MSSIATVQNYYSKANDKLLDSSTAIASYSINYFEIIGSMRSAAELTRMVYDKETKRLLLHANSKRLNNK